MKNNKIEACPISYSQVNKHLIKAYSSTVLVVLLATVLTGNHVGMYLITIDFLIRVFIGIKYSPLCNVLTQSLKITALKPLLVNAGAKQIAAQIGLLFCALICLTHWMELPILASGLTVMFGIAILLDLILDYCLACKMQSLYLTYIKKYF